GPSASARYSCRSGFPAGPRGEAMDTRLSVVIATRDRAAELLGTLQRLRALPERPHVVVVDNGSADGTPHAVYERFPDVPVIALSENRGAGARTLGAGQVDTPYVAFSD